MADNFGLKIGVEGEKEFKKAPADINQSFKVLGLEMKLGSSQFDKNDKSVQTLSARNNVLNKEIEAQRQKIDTLRSALQNASDSFGETDRRTQNWQIQLNNAEAALNDMERELSDNNAALEEANSNYGRAGDALKVDCERLLVRSAGSFDLKFFCPDPFACAVEDEEFTISSTGSHTVRRAEGNAASNPVYRIKGVVSSGANRYITITTNGSQLKIVNAALSATETLVVDTDMMTAWVENANGNVLRNGLPYLSELNFPMLSAGSNTIAVAANNATFRSLEIQAKSRWR